ncbi:glycosyl hydrolase family 28-related protein [Paenibacillus qinlingensis]|uniref:Rhamnogalacturonase A/B/Epimerase-like pectate lyase domain-containing protein n=1 Tax=Paenibacillus qinlingensis TaxID=1837343 RepID=A0ABU1NTR5_9BACL|nr:glycosyl hydrolase family 28-related protein [Paenibacillus qinlingensis]MDR6550875.1 hypothetical protein [Paenibacillus qinlingensis]
MRMNRFLFLLLPMFLLSVLLPYASYAAPTVVPVILRTSEAVKPGELLTVYGEYFESGITQVRFTGTTTYCPITYTDPQGHYVTCTIPAAQTAGIFTMEASNSVGWSSSFTVNAPKVDWIYNNNPWTGQTTKLVGRNLDYAEFGGTTNTLVRLVNGTNMYPATVTAVNPFSIDFVVPTCPNQGYTVQVSTNGGTSWTAYSGPQPYSTRKAGSDPLGLGVYWATNMVWTQHGVTPYGATGNGTTDDTAAIQSGIDDIKSSPGHGVLYLPNGTYRITSSLQLPAGIILQGQSQSGTIIKYDGPGGGSIIKTKDDGITLGNVGVARMTINVAGSNFPDIALRLGHNFDATVTHADTRTAAQIFVKEVTLDYTIDRAIASGQRGMGLNIVALKNVAIQNNTFKTTVAAMSASYVNQYLDISNNTFEYAGSAVHLTANYSVAQNNVIIGHSDYNRGDAHGFTVRSQAYLYNNDIRNLGNINHNDGEAIMGEPAGGGTKLYGAVSSVASKVLTVNGVTAVDWDLTNNRWDKWHLLIVDGKGMGQLNEVSALDSTASTVTVKDNWKVTPDSTSTFIVFLPLRGSVYYQNTSTNNAKGFWFYGDNIGGVIANNTSVDSEGVLANTVYNHNNKRFNISYFNRLERNIVTGYSPLSKVAGVGLRLSPEAKTAPFIFGNLAYGTDIKGNQITGVLPAPAIGNYSEAPDVNGIYAYRNTGYSQSRTISEAVNIQNNILNTLNKGITKDLNSNGLIKVGNTFTSVTVPNNDISGY